MKKLSFILVIVGAFFLTSCSATKTSTINLSGNIEGEQTSISSELMTKVVEVKKLEGDIVKAGEVIYILDSTNLKLQKEQAENQIKGLEVQIKTAKDKTSVDSINMAEYNLKAAQKSLEVLNKEIASLEDNTNDKLLNTNPILKEMNDKTKKDGLLKLKLQKEQTNNQISALKLQVKAVKDTSKDNVKVLEYNLKAAQSSLKLINENIKKATIRTPIAGLIDTINYKKGELVQLGGQLFTIADVNNAYLKVYLPERSLGKVKVGDKLKVSVTAIPNKTVEGKVIKIDQTGQFTPKNVETVDDKSAVVYGVKIKLSSNELKPGMIGEVSISE